MIKELVDRYMKELIKEEDIDGNSYKVLSSLVNISEDLGWSPVIEISYNEISGIVHMSKPTVMRAIENLENSHVIIIEDKKDRKGLTSIITILRINDIISSKEVSGKTNQSIKSVIKNIFDFNEDVEKLLIFDFKDASKEEDEVFDYIQNSGKSGSDLLEYTKSKGVQIFSQIKDQWEKFLSGNHTSLRFVPLGKVFAGVKKVYRSERSKIENETVTREAVQISLQALLPANSLNLNDLENPSKEELKIYADFLQIPFARSYYYLLLLCLLDRVFFLGRIYKKIKTTTYVDKREETHPKKNSKITRDEDKEIEKYSEEWVYLLLEKLEEQIEKEGLEVLRKSEQVNGGTVTFIKALKEWILYSIESENFHRVRFRALLQNIREFNTWKHPVYSIMHSISKSWNEVYEQKSTNESEENNNPYRLPPSIPEWMVKKQAEENRKKVERDDKIVEEALKLQAELREKGNNINKS